MRKERGKCVPSNYYFVLVREVEWATALQEERIIERWHGGLV